MSREKSQLVPLLLLLTTATACFSQENCIYRITASECLHEPTERILTGFIVKGTRGIFTALHGVVDAKHIGAVNGASRQAFSELRIIKVDIDLDVALLDSTELTTNLPGLEMVAISKNVDPGPLKVIGYPLRIGLIPTLGLRLRGPGFVELRSLLTVDQLRLIQERRSPFYDAQVLSIEGDLLPGHSGAPVLDSSNRSIRASPNKGCAPPFN
jgi:hypothetical protein